MVYRTPVPAFTGGVAALALSVGVTQAQDLQVIVHHLETSTELYISADADTLFSVFGTPSQVIPDTGSQIDFDAFLGGTWDIGDQLLDRTSLRIGDQPAGFEAMSFMLHPQTEAMAFETPFDALMSIGVCNALDSSAGLGLPDLRAYVGYFSARTVGDAPLSVTFPPGGFDEITVDLAVFGPGGELRSRHVVTADAPLQLPAAPTESGLRRLARALFGI